ncbi:MAG: 2Fe-2S iron-sulfur cluster-binding protein [Deltaproteobacteria bacterium]|nr:2Fe-2S iron-sulfur cluster-binding protein [Deltaproteobacteria bacterium]
MLEEVTLTIDDVLVKAVKGVSVLDAAVKSGICIPHLCHVPFLSDIGACRLCIVENVNNGKAKITTSCTLRVQEGMVIRANSEKVLKLRKNIAELLVAHAPNSRAIQDIAVRCGVKEVRYPFHNADCVLCGRCVRYCSEMWQGNAIGFVGRGKDRHVEYPFGKRPDTCKKCNSCVLYCPMSVTPCGNPMKTGEERLCGKCDSQMAMAEKMPGACVWCETGKSFQCSRYA